VGGRTTVGSVAHPQKVKSKKAKGKILNQNLNVFILIYLNYPLNYVLLRRNIPA
jgi:hypothetical protein